MHQQYYPLCSQLYIRARNTGTSKISIDQLNNLEKKKDQNKNMCHLFCFFKCMECMYVVKLQYCILKKTILICKFICRASFFIHLIYFNVCKQFDSSENKSSKFKINVRNIYIVILDMIFFSLKMQTYTYILFFFKNANIHVVL